MVLGVVGAGTMGAGIAQLGALAGMDTLVHDPVEGAVERGLRQIRVNLEKGAQRGRWPEDDARTASGRLKPAGRATIRVCVASSQIALRCVAMQHKLFGALAAGGELGNHARHLTQVLRAQVGQHFDVSTGTAVRSATVTSVRADRVNLNWEKPSRKRNWPQSRSRFQFSNSIAWNGQSRNALS